MKNLILLTSLMLFLPTILFSQENKEFKTNPVSEKTQIEAGEDFQFLSLKLIGLKTQTDRETLEKELNQNSNFKKVEITTYNEFHGFVQKSYLDQLNSFFDTKNIEISSTHDKIRNPLTRAEGSPLIVIPEEMKPKYIDTGNPEEDTKRHIEAKRKLLEEHPEYIKQ